MPMKTMTSSRAAATPKQPCCSQCGHSDSQDLSPAAELKLIEQSMQNLQARRDQLLTQLASTQAKSPSPPPLTRLPAELLLLIFRFCLLPDRYHDDAVDTRRAPWSLSHISSPLRHLTLSTPTLWHRIDLCLGHPKESPRSIHHTLALLTTRIARSAPVPLKLHVKVWRGTKSNHPVIKRLLEYSGRWGDVKFTASWGVVKEMLAMKGTFERLSSFEWYRRGLSEGGVLNAGAVVTVDPTGVATVVPTLLDVPTHSFDALKIAPNLKKLVFYNVDVSLGSLKAPWNQITQLALHYDVADARTLLALLGQTKALTSLELFYRRLTPPPPPPIAHVHLTPSSPHDPSTPPPTHPIIRLPALTTLTLPSLTTTDGPLISSLHLPALLTLSIGTLSNAGAHLLAKMLGTSCCWVTELTIVNASGVGERALVDVVLREMERCVRRVSVRWPRERAPVVAEDLGLPPADLPAERTRHMANDLPGFIGQYFCDALRFRWPHSASNSSLNHPTSNSDDLALPHFPFPALESLDLDNVFFAPNDAGAMLTSAVESRVLGPGEGEACCFSPSSSPSSSGFPSSSTRSGSEDPLDWRWTSPSSSRSPARLNHVSVQVAPYQPHPAEFRLPVAKTVTTTTLADTNVEANMDIEASSSGMNGQAASSSHAHNTSFHRTIGLAQLLPHAPGDAVPLVPVPLIPSDAESLVPLAADAPLTVPYTPRNAAMHGAAPDAAMNGVGWKLGSGVSEGVRARWRVLGEKGMRGEMRGR